MGLASLSGPVIRSGAADRWWWLALAAVLCAVAGWAVYDFAAKTPEPLGQIADFDFVERSGRRVRQQDLLGKVWIAGVTYSCCSMSCPQMRTALQWLQDRLRHSRVVLVNFSAAPVYDSPQELRKLADALGADPERWLFLTAEGPGGQDKVRRFVRESFHSDIVENDQAEPGLRFAHPTRLYLVDRSGAIRGSYACVEELLDGDGAPAGIFQIQEQELERLHGDALALDGGPLARWIPLGFFPSINAGLNATSGLLLIAGYLSIRMRRQKAHAACTVLATLISALFLASYVYYHFYHGATAFQGVGWIRPVYFGLLLSHTTLAAAVVPLALLTLYRAARKQFAQHRRVARWTFPVWLYVSATGVLIYLFLYHWFPG
jgi:uncharacterized membrane protein YozB (DUF420 family)/cytochrome oxidase Cu insertion factor (SCO1/SenC/PrrC family)